MCAAGRETMRRMWEYYTPYYITCTSTRFPPDHPFEYWWMCHHVWRIQRTVDVHNVLLLLLYTHTHTRIIIIEYVIHSRGPVTEPLVFTEFKTNFVFNYTLSLGRFKLVYVHIRIYYYTRVHIWYVYIMYFKSKTEEPA